MRCVATLSAVVAVPLLFGLTFGCVGPQDDIFADDDEALQGGDGENAPDDELAFPPDLPLALLGGCTINPANFPFHFPGIYGTGGQIVFDSNCDVYTVQPGPLAYLQRIHQTTGKLTNMVVGIGPGNLSGLAFRPSDGLFYASNSLGQVYSASTTTGVSTLIYDHPQAIRNLDIAPPGFGTFGGQILATTADGQLLAIEPSGPTITVVAAAPGGQLTGLAQGDDGTVYVVRQQHPYYSLNSVAPTGELTLRFNLPGPAPALVIDDAGNRYILAQPSWNQILGVDKTTGHFENLGIYRLGDGMLFDGSHLLFTIGGIEFNQTKTLEVLDLSPG